MNSVARQTAVYIREALDALTDQFHDVTRRARIRFETRDWAGAQADNKERIGLYKTALDDVISGLLRRLGAQINERPFWVTMKQTYADEIRGRQDIEQAETFYNSITRHIFTTVGVDPTIEYVGSRYERFSDHPLPSIYRTHFRPSSTAGLVASILTAYPFDVSYKHLDSDCRLAGFRIDQHLQTGYPDQSIESVEMLKSVFYRNKGAYLIGRLRTDRQQVMPILLAVLNTPGGLILDAVLLRHDEVAIVFSFTRSYFHVEAERPYELIDFLKSIMPQKHVFDLYIATGNNRHGKTELYRDIRGHLAASTDRFVVAPGIKGMVMAVFTLPSYDVVFKIIRDRFEPPKEVTHEQVRDRYRLVFLHDRVGRLMDTQEFEHLTFARRRFDPELLDELLNEAAQNVSVEGDEVIIRHMYVERRVTPLNLFIQHATIEEALPIAVDFGYAVKDLAAANIFPGDLFLKNFGVTPYGRVVFYDYDEISLLTECNFRSMPEASDPFQQMTNETWFFVEPDDVFPSEMKTYLGLKGPLREAFEAVHSDLYTVEFWQNAQAQLAAGRWMDFFPYQDESRLYSADAE